MIERDFIAQKTKEYYIKKYIEEKLKGVGISSIKLKKIPLGEKIIIQANRPSLIVGSKGSNIKSLTKTLKRDFKLENPQIEINEVKNIFLDANLVAERIASSLERFGSQRFKGIGHKTIENVLNAGAIGVELIISGKIPGARAKSWRFYQGYLKKCGDVAFSGVRKAQKAALLKSGIIGIKVAIMPPDLVLPDNIEILKEPITVMEEIPAEGEPKKATKKKASTKKKSVPKKEAPVKETKEAKEVKEGAEKTEVEPLAETSENNDSENNDQPAEEAIVEKTVEVAEEVAEENKDNLENKENESN